MSHAVKQAARRYGVTLTTEQVRSLADECRRSKWRAVRRQPTGVEYHYVDHEGVTMLALYHRRDDCLMTFLPLGPQWAPKRGKAHLGRVT